MYVKWLTSSGPCRGGSSTIHASAWMAATTSSTPSGRGTRRSRRTTRGVLAVAAPEPEDREQERREEDLQADNHQRGSENGPALFGEVAKTALGPTDDDEGCDREAGGEHAATQKQTVLQAEARTHALEPRVPVAHEVHAVRVCAEPERAYLRPDDHQQRAGDHRVQLPLASEQRQVGKRGDRDERADHQHDDAREQEQVRRAVHQQEAQVAPAIAEARELGLAPARVVLDRDLPDVELLLRRPDDHLGGELHPRRAEIERRQDRAPEAAHAAMGVAHTGAEEEGEDAREHGVADAAVQARHA